MNVRPSNYPSHRHMFNSRIADSATPGDYMLDETDRRILSVLQRDARTSMRKISKEVGVSLGTVSNRVRKLEGTGVIRGYAVLLDPEKIGWDLNVVIGLRIQKGRLSRFWRRLPRTRASTECTT